jgi:Na+/proline symporter
MKGLPLIDIVVIVSYFVIVVTIGILTTKKVTSQSDFYIGGRKFGKLLVMMQQFGAGTSNTHPILVAGAVYTFGMAGIWYSWLYMLFMPFLFVLLPIIRRLRMYTTADYFDLRYGKGLAPFFSVSCLASVCVATGTILLGMGQVVEGITQGGIDKNYTVLATAGVGLLYGALGGLVAAALTDVFQGILVIVLSFMLIPPMWSEVGGMTGLHQMLPPEMFSLAMPSGTGADPSKTIGLFAIFMLFINGMLGNLAEGSVQTLQAAKDEKTLQWGNLIGAMLKRTCTIGWALVGLFAAAIWPHLEDPEMCFGMAARQYLPAGLSGLMIACMFAAGMSTVSAFQVIASAIFTRNIYQKYFVKGKEDRHYLMMARISGLVLILCGLVVAYMFTNVTKAVEFWWKLTAMVGPAMMIGLFFRRGNSWGAWASIIVSFTVWWATEVFLAPTNPVWKTVWYQSALYIPAGVAAYFIVSLITNPEDERKLARFYARLNTPVGREHILVESGLEPNPDEIMPEKGYSKHAASDDKIAAEQIK